MRRPLRVLHIGNGNAFKIRAITEGLAARGQRFTWLLFRQLHRHSLA